MDAKRFAWLYMVENGVPGHKVSYYGGLDHFDKRIPKYDYKTGFDKARATVKEWIKNVGVDWTETKEPVSDKVARFTDTFHDPDYEEVLTGVMVFKDGTEVTWTADGVKVDNVFEFMEQVYSAAARFATYFGDENE